ncbi:MAG: glucose-6-phosphate isomerase [Bacteroidales bacterium]|nr:glucose-6-phosphate isomerase [Bacteroidales bacterium]
MENIKINITNTENFVSREEILKLAGEADKANKALYEKTGKGNDFLGWVNLPHEVTSDIIKKINATADTFKNDDFVVVIGIGGSYLGAKAVIDALSATFVQANNGPQVIYAGHNIGEDYMADLLDLLENRKYGIVVISKSGTTTEPAIAFRLLKAQLESKMGQAGAKDKIVAITDASKGALRGLADQEGYKTFVIPDDVGGRYSVLTPVGLVPIAISGLDIEKLVKGARDMEKLTKPGIALENNPSALYAATRNALYNKGYIVEILANYHHKLHYVAEWWKQLYGESEGKEGKGIFPASVDFTTDLHSMGQYIQEGERKLMETVISIKNPDRKVTIPVDNDNLDKLNFLSGKRIDEVNKMAELGTMLAHVDGGVPNILIELPKLDEYYLGQLLCFFEKACGISGYILGINPFDQPGVEAYKKNMFALLEKPGFEEETKKIKQRIGK